MPEMFRLCSNDDCNVWANNVLANIISIILTKTKTDQIATLILTGSLSRGEGSICKIHNKFHLLGDIEFLLVAKENVNLRNLEKEIIFLSKNTGNIVSEEFNASIDVDIGIVGHDFFKNKMQPSIFSYDLITNGKIVYGSDPFKREIMFPATAILQIDALALSMNRAVELIKLKTNGTTTDLLTYHLVKILLDLAGSYLAFTGNYVSKYCDRAAAIKNISIDLKWPVSQIHLPEYLNLLDIATRCKITPELFFTFNSLIFGKKYEIKKWLFAIILWEMAELTGINNSSPEAILEKYKKHESFLNALKGWIKFLHHSSRHNYNIKFSAMLCELFCASPKTLIYSSILMSYLGIYLYHDQNLVAAGDKCLKPFPNTGNTKSTLEYACRMWDDFIRHN